MESVFCFDFTTDAKYGTPFLMKIYWDSTKAQVVYELIRMQVTCNEQHGYKYINVSGSYSVHEGEIVCEFHPDKYGNIICVYVVHDNDLLYVSDRIDHRVIAYLKHKIPLSELLH